MHRTTSKWRCRRVRSGAVDVVVNKPGGPTLVGDAFLYRHDHQAGRDFAHTSNPNDPWHLDLAAGDILDFTVGYGGNGYAYDQAAMQITIVGDLLHVDGFE